MRHLRASGVCGLVVALLALVAGCPSPSPRPPPLRGGVPPPPIDWSELERKSLVEQVDLLVDRVGHPNLAVSQEALAALERIGPPAVPRLIQALYRTTGRRRANVVEAVGLLGDPSAVPDLLATGRSVRSETPYWAERIVLSVGRAVSFLGSPEGLPLLIDLLASSDTEVRIRAVGYLRRFTHLSLDYRYDASDADREAAIARWRRWWEQSGSSFRVVGART